MASKGSGKEYIEHDVDIVANIGEHFNRDDLSDVTLKVGEQVFAAHRFVLATQSKVFMTMLMGENWKESEEKKIALEETPEGAAVFPNFLKFFYTGKLTLTIDNVRAIHVLSDKYDVGVLKDDCVSFMKDVLTGVHGDALWAALQWLQFAESFLSSDIVALCYSAIRGNFDQVCYTDGKHKEAFKKLSNDQVKEVLSVSGVEDELVLYDEDTLLNFLNNDDWGRQFLPFVRFYNIDVDDLDKYDNLDEEYLNAAYKIHAEKSNIAVRACKRRRTSEDQYEVKCPCDKSVPMECPHINPRLYLGQRFGNLTYMSASDMGLSYSLSVDPDDLFDVERFLKKHYSGNNPPTDRNWKIRLKKEYSGDAIYESFTVTPNKAHLGRKFTLAIACVMANKDEVIQDCEFVIKYTGKVTKPADNRRYPEVNPFTFVSPLRLHGSWELQDHHLIMATILLHD